MNNPICSVQLRQVSRPIRKWFQPGAPQYLKCCIYYVDCDWFAISWCRQCRWRVSKTQTKTGFVKSSSPSSGRMPCRVSLKSWGSVAANVTRAVLKLNQPQLSDSYLFIFIKQITRLSQAEQGAASMDWLYGWRRVERFLFFFLLLQHCHSHVCCNQIKMRSQEIS